MASQNRVLYNHSELHHIASTPPQVLCIACYLWTDNQSNKPTQCNREMSVLVGELSLSNEHQLRMKEIGHLEVTKKTTDLYSAQLETGRTCCTTSYHIISYHITPCISTLISTLHHSTSHHTTSHHTSHLSRYEFYSLLLIWTKSKQFFESKRLI